ncbi:DUF2127 domain-containing protein [Mariprofundus erugo]|uniref:DUF2127 domain-containing protein n=1 Tax=Mariprofundus erugo TaxID=2528639 RepID=A0A5R9GH54_9PROT|nr:DUF2127 domain-containing protein [Mariprofundus erugo]TLS66166.1 DUF2127 domain-containing protein [Mariprofundus erugo]
MNQIGLKPIAMIEASKGLLALAAGLGILEFAGNNLQQVAGMVVAHLHLNPASQYSGIFLKAAGDLANINLVLIAVGALVYSLVRFIEAYGLWHRLRWVEWFALISGGMYMPFEIYECIVKPPLISASFLTVNCMVVAYLYLIIKGKSD